MAYTYDQLGKSKALNDLKGYNKIAQQIMRFDILQFNEYFDDI